MHAVAAPGRWRQPGAAAGQRVWCLCVVVPFRPCRSGWVTALDQYAGGAGGALSGRRWRAAAVVPELGAAGCTGAGLAGAVVGEHGGVATGGAGVCRGAGGLAGVGPAVEVGLTQSAMSIAG